MRGRIVLFFAFLLIVFGTISRAGQQSIQGGRISGQVLDGVTGEPLKDARVILQDRGSGNQREVVTDDKGLFVLEDIQPGSYLLHPERTGYVTMVEFRPDGSVQRHWYKNPPLNSSESGRIFTNTTTAIN